MKIVLSNETIEAFEVYVNGCGIPAYPEERRGAQAAPPQVVEATLFRVGVMSLCPMKWLYRPIESVWKGSYTT
jgi:hypothetical protein